MFNVWCNFIPGKPGKPETPKIGAMTARTVDLTWAAPASDGGSAITNYIVEYKIENGFKWTRANTESVIVCKYTVKGLKEEQIYEFRVTAENKAGAGPPSDSTKPTQVVAPLVGTAPKVEAGLKDVTVVAPTNAELACEITTGDPKADITW